MSYWQLTRTMWAVEGIERHRLKVEWMDATLRAVRRGLIATMVPFILITLVLAFSGTSHAQPQEIPPIRAYLLDHPINVHWLVLATHDGRFSVTRPPECSWMRGDLNVELSQPVTIGSVDISLLDGSTSCTADIIELVDSTPCFTNEAGECDLDAGEHNF